jgi:hypothetical protein
MGVQGLGEAGVLEWQLWDLQIADLAIAQPPNCRNCPTCGTCWRATIPQTGGQAPAGDQPNHRQTTIPTTARKINLNLKHGNPCKHILLYSYSMLLEELAQTPRVVSQFSIVSYAF